MVSFRIHILRLCEYHVHPSHDLFSVCSLSTGVLDEGLRARSDVDEEWVVVDAPAANMPGKDTLIVTSHDRKRKKYVTQGKRREMDVVVSKLMDTYHFGINVACMVQALSFLSGVNPAIIARSGVLALLCRDEQYDPIPSADMEAVRAAGHHSPDSMTDAESPAAASPIESLLGTQYAAYPSRQIGRAAGRERV